MADYSISMMLTDDPNRTIPKNLVYRKNPDNYAFVSYIDPKTSKIRSEATMIKWAPKSEFETVPNIPCTGFKIVGRAGGFSGDLRKAYITISDPRGWYIEIDLSYFIELITRVGYNPETGFTKPVVYSWWAGQRILIPATKQELSDYYDQIEAGVTVQLKDLVPGQYYKTKNFEGYYIGSYSCLRSDIITPEIYRVSKYVKKLGRYVPYTDYGFYCPFNNLKYQVISASTGLLHWPNMQPLTTEQIEHHYNIAKRNRIINVSKDAKINKIMQFKCQEDIEAVSVNDPEFLIWTSKLLVRFFLISPDNRHVMSFSTHTTQPSTCTYKCELDMVDDMYYTTQCFDPNKIRTIKSEDIPRLYPGYTAYRSKNYHNNLSIIDNTGQIHRDLQLV